MTIPITKNRSEFFNLSLIHVFGETVYTEFSELKSKMEGFAIANPGQKYIALELKNQVQCDGLVWS